MKRIIHSGLLAVAVAFAAIGVSAQQSTVVNFISVGGPDTQDPDIEGSTPGFDKNFSLTAFKYADGSASGNLIDRYAGDGGLGLQARIDCVVVDGNRAWVSGVITRGQTLDVDGSRVNLAGWYMRTTAQDNGPNTDPLNPDMIGFTIVRPDVPFDCTLRRGALFDMPNGQVIVR